MQLRALWQVILKTLGIFSAISVANVISVILAGGLGDLKFLVTELLILIVEFIIAFLLLNRTNELIDRFRLVSTVEQQTLQFSFDAKRVLRLAIAVIGLYNLALAIPELFVSGSAPSLLYSLSKIAIALLMILKSEELEHLFFKNYHQNDAKKDGDLDL